MATTNSMNYSLDGVPMITYGIIGITTLVLAAVTIMSKDGTAIPATPSPAAPAAPAAPETTPAAPAAPAAPVTGGKSKHKKTKRRKYK